MLLLRMKIRNGFQCLLYHKIKLQTITEILWKIYSIQDVQSLTLKWFVIKKYQSLIPSLDFHSILVFLPLILHWESRTSSIFSSRRPFTLHNLPVRFSSLCSAFSLSSLSLTSWLLTYKDRLQVLLHCTPYVACNIAGWQSGNFREFCQLKWFKNDFIWASKWNTRNKSLIGLFKNSFCQHGMVNY